MRKVIIEFLFKPTNASDQKSHYVALVGLVIDEFIEDGKLKRIPYEIVTNYVFHDIELPEEANEILTYNLEKMITFSPPENHENLKHFKDKIVSHYNLCKEQKKYIQRNISDLNKQISLASNEINASKKEIRKTVEETNDVNADIRETKNKMYTEFVAILGIFSALMFGMISGFDLISDSLSLLATESISIGRIIMGTSALGISLLTLMYTLIQWIGHLIRNPIRPENFVKDSPLNSGLIGFEYRHSLFLLAIYLLLNVFLIGVLLTLLSNSGFISAIYNGSITKEFVQKKSLALTIIIITLGLIFYIDYYLIIKRLFSSKKKNNPTSD